MIRGGDGGAVLLFWRPSGGSAAFSLAFAGGAGIFVGNGGGIPGIA